MSLAVLPPVRNGCQAAAKLHSSLSCKQRTSFTAGNTNQRQAPGSISRLCKTHIYVMMAALAADLEAITQQCNDSHELVVLLEGSRDFIPSKSCRGGTVVSICVCEYAFQPACLL